MITAKESVILYIKCLSHPLLHHFIHEHLSYNRPRAYAHCDALSQTGSAARAPAAAQLFIHKVSVRRMPTRTHGILYMKRLSCESYAWPGTYAHCDALSQTGSAARAPAAAQLYI